MEKGTNKSFVQRRPNLAGLSSQRMLTSERNAYKNTDPKVHYSVFQSSIKYRHTSSNAFRNELTRHYGIYRKQRQ